MAITTYDELQDAVADFLDRDDLNNTITTFIELAEADFNRAIRHWRMEARSTGQQSAGDQYMQMPSDWLETRRFILTGNGTSVLSLSTLSAMAALRASNNDASGVPTHYAVTDGQFELYPTPSTDTEAEVVYIQKIPALTDDNESNWLLADSPDVYLYGTLMHSAPYLQEDERIAVWSSLYASGLERLSNASDASVMSGTGLTMSNRGLG